MEMESGAEAGGLPGQTKGNGTVGVAKEASNGGPPSNVHSATPIVKYADKATPLPFDRLVAASPAEGPNRIIAAEDYCTSDPSVPVRLHVGESGLAATPPISMITCFEECVKRSPNHTALRVGREGTYQTWTYTEYMRDVKLAAKGFLSLGLEKHHGVCILGFNAPEWFISYMGAIYAGGVAAGVYTTNSVETTRHCGVLGRANVFVVENQKMLDKVLACRNEIPTLKAIVMWEGSSDEPGVFSWPQLLEKGRSVSDSTLDSAVADQAINQACNIIYTSGTTGLSKAVLLSHDNMIYTSRMLSKHTNMENGDEHIVSYLPLSHIAAQIMDLVCGIIVTATVTFAKPDALKGTLVNTLRETRPTVFLGVPRVWEKFQEKMLEIGQSGGCVKKTIGTWAKASGLNYHKSRLAGSRSGSLSYNFFKSLAFSKIKAGLGFDRCRLFASGAAPLSEEISEYFLSVDIPICQVYGMSECTGPASMEVYDRMRIGSVGITLCGVQNRIYNPDNDGIGEVCMKGRHVFMGYLSQEDKTRETVDEKGWLHSGDLGRKDGDGFVIITGRIKEILITAGGENVAPVLIEDNIKKELNAISNVMLIGDRKKFLSCLVTLRVEIDPDTGSPLEELTAVTKQWLSKMDKNYSTVSEIVEADDPDVNKAITDAIGRANKIAVSNAQKVQKFKLLKTDFSVPGGELGPTMKLKRPVVLDLYSKVIESIYA